MTQYKQIILAKGREQSFFRKHPWIFSGAIKQKDANLHDGEIVEVLSSEKVFLGIGHYQDGSIAIRVLSYEYTDINTDFWFTKISKAYNYRKAIGLIDQPDMNAYRLVFGEADEMPGLVIDYYNNNLVIQCHAIGMHLSIKDIVEALKKIYGSKLETIYDKSVESLPATYASQIKNGFLFGSNENTIIQEYGNKFQIDWVRGQKTGFFIDQRENRKLLAHYSKGKKVLNTFCYTGGFSVYASLAGASLVHSVDSSKAAIELTKKNIELNGITNHEAFAVDTFDFFKTSDTDYDVIILDPPAFAKSRKVTHNAVIGYKRLNAEAFKRIKSGGIVFTFSCSQVIDKELFFNTIVSAAIEAKKTIKVLHYLSQPADHPINMHFLEGEYLKGLVLWVE
ncbi:MAG: class I SAM-dependent rRNA methyltransferase [Bacteroidota bacterium]|nr:class I SAM-dependent rRNA methyltransferase [Bacteroidota bacterium]